MFELKSQQKGECGVLLVRYWLLKNGIESARLTTDFGVDLVAYNPTSRKPMTIQVKTCTERGREGGKWVEWTLSNDCPSEIVAVVDLDRNEFWLIPIEKFRNEANRAGEGRRRWWSLPGHESKGSHKRHLEDSFKDYKMVDGIRNAFGLRQEAGENSA